VGERERESSAVLPLRLVLLFSSCDPIYHAKEKERKREERERKREKRERRGVGSFGLSKMQLIRPRRLRSPAHPID
jgi:hypothetical protein